MSSRCLATDAQTLAPWKNLSRCLQFHTLLHNRDHKAISTKEGHPEPKACTRITRLTTTRAETKNHPSRAALLRAWSEHAGPDALKLMLAAQFGSSSSRGGAWNKPAYPKAA